MATLYLHFLLVPIFNCVYMTRKGGRMFIELRNHRNSDPEGGRTCRFLHATAFGVGVTIKIY
jgi:hypothetical protein